MTLKPINMPMKRLDEVQEWLTFDAGTEVLTIYGVQYAQSLFRELANQDNVGVRFEIARNDGGALCLLRLEADTNAQ